MKNVPTSMRPHIGIFGRRNAGKSSLINALTGQDTAIVSEVAGTTTDPVGKAMEILPLGPVFIVDTAGLDDAGELGEKRVKKSLEVLGHSDLIVIAAAPSEFDDIEKSFIEKMQKKGERILTVFTKSDIEKPSKEAEAYLNSLGIPFLHVSSSEQTNIRHLREKMAVMIPEIITSDIIIRDMLSKDDIVIHVMPIDSAAPKGRIILPQEQALRDSLDANAISLVVQTDQLDSAIKSLSRKPALVITDSQAIEAVDRITPKDIAVTTYSIVFSRLKGDLVEFVRGLKVLDKLEENDNIYIAEACTHHSQPDDIGRYKIPKWLQAYTGKKLNFTVNPGKMIHKDMKEHSLVIHCGGCMVNRKEVLSRIGQAGETGIPITNYGVIISHMHNALERTLSPFPEALAVYRKEILNKE